MSDIPKGHHGSAGVVPVLLSGTDVYRLHQWAEKHKMADQVAATVLLRGVLSALENGQIEIAVVEQDPDLN